MGFKETDEIPGSEPYLPQPKPKVYYNPPKVVEDDEEEKGGNKPPPYTVIGNPYAQTQQQEPINFWERLAAIVGKFTPQQPQARDQYGLRYTPITGSIGTGSGWAPPPVQNRPGIGTGYGWNDANLPMFGYNGPLSVTNRPRQQQPPYLYGRPGRDMKEPNGPYQKPKGWWDWWTTPKVDFVPVDPVVPKPPSIYGYAPRYYGYGGGGGGGGWGSYGGYGGYGGGSQAWLQGLMNWNIG